MSPHWFGRDEVSPGAIIELEHRWLVLSQKEEYEFQGSEKDDPKWTGPSYACIQLKVRQVGSKPPVNEYMRVYKQISTKEIVADRPEVRARQAQALVPPELKAYRQLTRNESTFIPKLLDSLEGRQNFYGFVPGGFVVWIVTEQVPGVRLGNSVSDETFWSMEPSVRAEIRASFKEGYVKMLRWGWLPLYNCCGDLVWNADSSTVYFVNWFMAVQLVTPQTWTDHCYANAGLVKVPVTNDFRFTFCGYTGSTEGWEW
ncbi:hypothetical protein ASPBRDRAFT_655931 [Aspergillus brasiliensis CBS 101740]|uniref:Uncharacterized protein n=1 Tax=Aspergillus brasiliensis (strain CBS 101740 / IMI 381727 / IBT 21946) TaxID=767769 RepID=A0A1L9V1W6_ASPBC|nr:hypothetical protein ASPBRDRAFT_655931 [Aspergillus brasiliensis CBS 101740]